jgi:Di-haem oxidoreductase, putative peroxidase
MKTHNWKKPGAGLLIGAVVIGVAAALVHAQQKTEQPAPKIPQPNAAISSGTNADGKTTPFENKTNGFENQEAFDKDRQAFEDVETIKPETVCAKKKCDEERVADLCVTGCTKGGLGPVYNATSCAVCHQNPITGAASQISEIRAGHIESFGSGDPKLPPVMKFVEPRTGSLVHQRANSSKIQERVPREETSRTFRLTTNILGDGFVEVLADTQITDVQKKQPGGLKGLAVVVAVTVKRDPKLDLPPNFGFNHQFRIGRFGWKCQHASLLNFSADAYINEMGITSPLQDKENKSNTLEDIKPFDGVLFPEEHDDTLRPPNPAKQTTEDKFSEEEPFGEDVQSFTRFMRSTNPPPRNLAGLKPDDVKKGDEIFNDKRATSLKPIHPQDPIRTLACAICHQPTFQKPEKRSRIVALTGGGTAPPGSDINTESVVPDALGRDPAHPNPEKDFINPYSDFMLHDIGTGDGIAQTQHAQLEPVGLRNGRLNELLKTIGSEKAKGDEALPTSELPSELFQLKEGKLQPFLRLQNAKGFPLSESGDNDPVLTMVRVLNVTMPKEGEVPKRSEVPRELDQRTTDMIRTAPLWGLRTRPQLMHDGLSLTIDDAIQRHKVRAVYQLKDNAGNNVGPKFEVNLPQNFDDLNQDEKDALRAFLKSL